MTSLSPIAIFCVGLWCQWHLSAVSTFSTPASIILIFRSFQEFLVFPLYRALGLFWPVWPPQMGVIVIYWTKYATLWIDGIWNYSKTWLLCVNSTCNHESPVTLNWHEFCWRFSLQRKSVHYLLNLIIYRPSYTFARQLPAEIINQHLNITDEWLQERFWWLTAHFHIICIIWSLT